MLVGVIVKTSCSFVSSSGGVGVGRHGQNSGLAGGGRGQLAFHTICEDPRQPGAGAGHLMQHWALQHCSRDRLDPHCYSQ